MLNYNNIIHRIFEIKRNKKSLDIKTFSFVSRDFSLEFTVYKYYLYLNCCEAYPQERQRASHSFLP